MCKRWHGVVTTDPRLLQSLDVELSCDTDGHLRSLLRFLSAAAPHVQQLSLFLEAPPHNSEPKAHQLAAELQARLGRCTQLECLSLRLGGVPCTLGPWLAPLAGSLRRLALDHTAGGAIMLWLESDGPAACTKLETLAISGSRVQLWTFTDHCWPAGLTSLELRLLWDSKLPTSVR